MLDKNELQELLVRLQLGTLTVEAAIKEIVTQSAEESSESYCGIWKRVHFGFDEVIFAIDQDVSAIITKIEEFTARRRDFVVIGLCEDKLTALAKRFPDFSFHHKAGIAAGTFSKKQSTRLCVKIITSGVSRIEMRLADEAAALLDIAGINTQVYTDMRDKSLADRDSMKNALKGADAIIAIVTDDGYTVPLAAACCSAAIVVMATDINHPNINLRKSDGILFAQGGDSFGACMAILRILCPRQIK